MFTFNDETLKIKVNTFRFKTVFLQGKRIWYSIIIYYVIIIMYDIAYISVGQSVTVVYE